SGQQPSKQTNGTTDKNVDTLLSSQETDTQVSLTSKAYQAIASLLPIFFLAVSGFATLSDIRGTICTVPFPKGRSDWLAARAYRPATRRRVGSRRSASQIRASTG